MIPLFQLELRSRSLLPETEVELNLHRERHRLPIFECGAVTPLPDSFDSLLIQAHAKGANNVWVHHMAGGIDIDIQNYFTFSLGCQGFFGVFRIDLVNKDRRNRVMSKNSICLNLMMVAR